MKIAPVYEFPPFDTGLYDSTEFLHSSGNARLLIRVKEHADIILEFKRLRWHEFTALYNCSTEQIETAYFKLVRLDDSEQLTRFLASDRAPSKAYKELYHFRVFVAEHGCHELFAQSFRAVPASGRWNQVGQGRSSANSQESVAANLSTLVLMHGRVSAEITKDGPLLHGTSEPDLELAIENLRRPGRQVLVGKPQINYIHGENWHEPFASLIVKLPTECTEVVRSDLLQRRAEVQHLESSRDGATTIRAFAPMSEIFGYAASLRTLTGGRGSFEQEFVDYRPFPSRQAIHLTSGGFWHQRGRLAAKRKRASI